MTGQPRLASPAELAAVVADHPGHRAWAEAAGSRVRYVARARDLHATPHTVVTASLARLRAALAGARTTP